MTLKILPHLIGVVTLPCEMSDIALSPVTTMANCMINVDWAWHVAFKQPELKFCRLCCLRGSFIDGLSVLTIHDNSGALSGANCRSVWLIALLASGVISLSASSSSKADKLNIWCENCEILQLLWTITEAINRLFCCKFFKMCCYRYRLVFNCCFKDINILLGSVATHLRCDGIFSNSVNAIFFFFSDSIKIFKIG